MPKLHVFYDPHDKIGHDAEGNLRAQEAHEIKTATLSVPQNLKSVDIYNLARRLAELLLEQL